MMVKRSHQLSPLVLGFGFVGLLFLLLFGARESPALPSIQDLRSMPSAIVVNQDETVLITARIEDSSLISGSVYLWRLNEANKAVANLGVLHDDGLGGDGLAGDKVFSLRVNLRENVTGYVRLRITAAFRRLLKRIQSDILAIRVWDGLSVLNVNSDLWATNQGVDGIAVCWASVPTGGATIVIDRALGLTGPWVEALRLPLGAGTPNCVIDSVDGTTNTFYYRARILDAANGTLQDFEPVEVPPLP